MAKNYRSLTCEVHDMHLALESAYNRGYEQAREDYSKELGNWSFITSSDIGEYECSVCNRRAFAPHKFCPNCGSSMDFVIKMRLERITK